jgi:hypothetical protein
VQGLVQKADAERCHKDGEFDQEDVSWTWKNGHVASFVFLPTLWQDIEGVANKIFGKQWWFFNEEASRIADFNNGGSKFYKRWLTKINLNNGG